MRLLFCGDIVGRSGRDVLCEHIPRLRKELALDFVAANGENAAGGFGITEKICQDLYGAGVDAITSGNHVWDQRETSAFIDRHPRLLRPQNYPLGTPGKGSQVYQTAAGRKVMVAAADRLIPAATSTSAAGRRTLFSGRPARISTRRSSNLSSTRRKRFLNRSCIETRGNWWRVCTSIMNDWMPSLANRG